MKKSALESEPRGLQVKKKLEGKYLRIDEEMEDILLYLNFVIMFFFDTFLKHFEFIYII